MEAGTSRFYVASELAFPKRFGVGWEGKGEVLVGVKEDCWLALAGEIEPIEEMVC
jgi:hypothetical protein